MRVLFLHITGESRNEYTVHYLLAEHVDPERIDCHFIGQDGTFDPATMTRVPTSLKQRSYYFDFGRDMAIQPRPFRLKRLAMMLARLPSGIRFILERIRAVQPDVLYTSQQYYEVCLGRLLSLFLKIPHVIHMSYPIAPELGKPTCEIIRYSPLILCCSDFVRDTAIRYGARPECAATIRHGADLKQFDIPRNPARLRQKFDLPPESIVITIAARIDRGKGYPALIEAFARVHHNRPQTRLLICGNPFFDPDYEAVIRSLVAQRGLSDAVVFAGHRTDLPEILADADLFCMPTENDALPLVFLAAMAAALPIVAVRSGGIPEMVLHNETGLLSDVGDTEALVNNIERLLDDKTLAARFTSHAKERACTVFRPDIVASEWADILERRVSALTSRRA